MEKMDLMLVRLSLLESAVAALAQGLGAADVIAAQQEQMAVDPQLAHIDPECFALLRLIRQRPGAADLP